MAFRNAEGDDAAVIAGLLARLLLQRGPMARALQVLDEALSSTNRVELRLPLLRYQSIAMKASGRVDEARAVLEKALAQDSEGCAVERARMLCVLGVLEGQHGAPQRAQEHFVAALVDYRTAGSPLDECVVFAELATLRYLEGELDAAAALLESALARFGESGESWVYAMYLGNLAAVELVADHLSSAALHLNQALELHRRFGSVRGEAVALGNLALVEDRRGYRDVAFQHLVQGLTLSERAGDRCQQGNLWSTRGLVELGRGNLGEAMRCLDRAMGIAERQCMPRLEAEVLVRRGRVQSALGEHDHALGSLERAEVLCDALQLGTESIEAGLARVEAWFRQGDRVRAAAALAETERRAGGRRIPDHQAWTARVEGLA